MFLDTLINNLHKSIYRFPEVIRYLHSRHVTDEEIAKHKIGYNKIVGIPEDPGEDRKRMMEECYRGRKLEQKIIFPIRDVMGNTVGLVGRSVITKDFKIYVTEIAKYMGFFFGLYEALPYVYKKNKIYVVEGKFDYFALSKVFPNTVATLTSWLSEAQYGFLRCFCDTIVVVFDSDEAGVRGSEKASEYEGVIRMGLGSFKDPAVCLEKLSLPGFKKFILRYAPLDFS